jgi:hypothetical protein
MERLCSERGLPFSLLFHKKSIYKLDTLPEGDEGGKYCAVYIAKTTS